MCGRGRALATQLRLWAAGCAIKDADDVEPPRGVIVVGKQSMVMMGLTRRWKAVALTLR